MTANSNCPVCNGHVIKTDTSFTVELGTGIIVVRHVPALMCQQCSSEWFEDNVSETLEKIVNEAKQKNPYIEVSDYSSYVQIAS